MEQINQEKRSFLGKSKSFFLKSKRVFKITKKPTKDEFKVIVKVTAIGMGVIGLVGFLIHFGWTLIS